MEHDLDSWEERVANPDALADREKALWKKIEPIFNDVLDELKANDKIETVYVKTEMDKLFGSLKTLEKTTVAHNNLIHIFENMRALPQNEQSQFFKKIRGFGFEEMVGMYLGVTVTVTLLSTELFKLLLLFHLKNVSHKISEFSSTMRNAAPRNWPKLKPFVDNDFRNSLAHGTYALVGEKVMLYKDAKLIPFQEMKLHEFMMRGKNQNVLFQCFVNVLVAKKVSGFFT